MRPAEQLDVPCQAPRLLDKAKQLAEYLRTLSTEQIQLSMKLSPAMAEKTRLLLSDWSTNPDMLRPAIDAFLGDIYSGLQVHAFSPDDRAYANNHLFILSGLYGALRAHDSIYPYRLEMGYKLPEEPYKSLYKFWGDDIAKLLPLDSTIINLSAVEYTKAIFPHLPSTQRVITPKFLTVNPKTGEQTFVTVHTKVARGAFARWLIQHRIDTPEAIVKFNDIGYNYDDVASTPEQPVFVCNEFGGIGLSVRLS